jgi:hydroxyacylglutathione hydrolase
MQLPSPGGVLAPGPCSGNPFGGRARRRSTVGASQQIASEEVSVERSMNTQWLSNTYLVLDDHGADAVMIDAGGPVQPLLELIEAQQRRLTHVLLTHHHHDHVDELPLVLERHPDAQVLIHELERDDVPAATGDLVPGTTLEIGTLRVQPLHTPGHTTGMVSVLVDGTDVFTGDTLFRGSVGGVRGGGATGYEDIRHSIMDVLLALPGQTRIHPGHTDPTTVADELAHNPFVLVWSGKEPEGDRACSAFGRPATLIVFADDYDGGHKAWVRWPDGSDAIVPGSQVIVPDAV